MKRTALGLAAAGLGLSLLVGPVAAQTTSDPIPGVDIVVKPSSGGSIAVVVGQTGRDGRYSGSVRVESGSYQVYTACPARHRCPAFRLTSVNIDGRPLTPNARGEFVFPVGGDTREVKIFVETALGEVSTSR